MANAAVAPPVGVLNEQELYFGDNGRCHCARLECAGARAFFSGIALDGGPVISLTEAASVEALDLSQFACETCGRKYCPDCGALMEKGPGTISELVIQHGTLNPVRKARPATFYACTGCERHEEVTRA